MAVLRLLTDVIETGCRMDGSHSLIKNDTMTVACLFRSLLSG